MTTAQLAAEHAKLPKIVDCDSDEEPIHLPTPLHVRQARNYAMAAMQTAPTLPPLPSDAPATTVSFNGGNGRYTPINLDDEYAGEIIAALDAQRDHAPSCCVGTNVQSLLQQAIWRTESYDDEELFGEDKDDLRNGRFTRYEIDNGPVVHAVPLNETLPAEVHIQINEPEEMQTFIGEQDLVLAVLKTE